MEQGQTDAAITDVRRGLSLCIKTFETMSEALHALEARITQLESDMQKLDPLVAGALAAIARFDKRLTAMTTEPQPVRKTVLN